MAEDKKTSQVEVHRTADRSLLVRLMGVGLVLYWLFGIVKAYFQGGPEAPSLTLLILSALVLGGGSAIVIIMSLRMWKKARAAKEKEDDAPAPEELPQ